MDKLLLKPEDVAEVLSIGRTRVYGLLRRGVIASVQIGRSRLVTAAELQRYVDELSGASA